MKIDMYDPDEFPELQLIYPGWEVEIIEGEECYFSVIHVETMDKSKLTSQPMVWPMGFPPILPGMAQIC